MGKKKSKEADSAFMVYGMIIGMLVGISTGNIGLWLPLGMVLGIAYENKINKKK